jgi:tetratricopeptide (TPR) repeat protein
MTDLGPLFSRIVLGGAEASLDIAGAALLPPPAWPILKAALQPVMERLKERLGGEDITASKEAAERAIKEFEADQHLQEMLRSKLLEQLGPLAAGQQAIDAGVQKLMILVSSDQKLLTGIADGVDRLNQHLDQGVNLSDEALDKIYQRVAQRAENSRQARGLALRQMGPVAQLLEDQVHRAEARAVELISSHDLDRASDELQAALTLVSALIVEAPSDLTLRLLQGFVYKGLSQVYAESGDSEQVDAYISRAEEVFNRVLEDSAGDAATTVDIANAVHGLGNVEHGRSHFVAAIAKYKLATSLLPQHYYAWHDMFACYVELAKQGQVDLVAMRHALTKVEETGRGQPGLGAQHIGELEATMRYFEEHAAKPTAAAQAD